MNNFAVPQCHYGDIDRLIRLDILNNDWMKMKMFKSRRKTFENYLRIEFKFDEHVPISFIVVQNVIDKPSVAKKNGDT